MCYRISSTKLKNGFIWTQNRFVCEPNSSISTSSPELFSYPPSQLGELAKATRLRHNLHPETTQDLKISLQTEPTNRHESRKSNGDLTHSCVSARCSGCQAVWPGRTKLISGRLRKTHAQASKIRWERRNRDCYTGFTLVGRKGGHPGEVHRHRGQDSLKTSKHHADGSRLDEAMFEASSNRVPSKIKNQQSAKKFENSDMVEKIM